MDKETFERGVEPGFRGPGKPTDHANVERFNGRPRDGCFDVT